jgi:hypothetical protein
MTNISTSVKPSTDLPQLDSLIPWTTDQVVPVHNKSYIAYIVVVTVECLAAYVVVSEVPELYAQVARAWD